MANPPERLIDRILQSPLGRKIIADQEAELDAQRAAAITAIKDAHARSAREVPPLQARVEKSLKAVKDAGVVLTGAQRQYGAASAELFDLSNEESRVITMAEATLIDTAPDSVKTFQRWLFDEFDRARSGVRVSSAGSTGNPDMGVPTRRFVQTNVPSTQKYIDSINAARQEMHVLVLTESSGAVIETRIVELQRGLANNVVEEVVVEGRA